MSTTPSTPSAPSAPSAPSDRYDAVVVGGRCAGAATAMLLARAGLRVLVLEAGRAGTDTLSTHALMRGAVLQLERWGLLPALDAAGTPPIRATEFHVGGEVETVAARPGITPLRAPRRTVLDPLLVDAAVRAGAEVRHGARVTGLLHGPGDAVAGVEYRDPATGTIARACAPITVGADGRRSSVAEAVGAPVEHAGTAASAFLVSYRTGFALDRYRWCYRPGATAGVIPTNDGRVCLWAGVPAARFGSLRGDLDGAYRALLHETAPELDDEIAAGEGDGRVRAHPGLPGWSRTPAGRGWALVGDAGYFKDPITAHGITDALRDAELLARAVIASPRGGADRRAALAQYQHRRDELSAPLAAITERLASYEWDLAELADLLPALSAAMKPEVAALRALDPSVAPVAAA